MTAEAKTLDTRVLPPAELPGIVRAMRQGKKWSQAQLAEIARLTERTIQRVEGGDPRPASIHGALSQERSATRTWTFLTGGPFRPLINCERL
jgi:transcriptional regulator with XRE-family HTH domain